MNKCSYLCITTEYLTNYIIQMKIAITSQGMSADSLLDSRFGRCTAFAIYDTDTKALDFIKNPNKDIDEGAGPASVSLVANQGVSRIISGEFGFKIKGLLTDLKIQMDTCKENISVQEIINQL